MPRLNDILEKVSTYKPDADFDLIKKAYVYSSKVHQGQIRKSGEPYLVHPLEVASILGDLKLDEASIVAGLLHDTIEDTLAKPEEIKEHFGEDVLNLVEGVTKLSKFSPAATASHEEKQAENFRKMVVAMARDIRVILVKLADRLHNMRTLEHMKPEGQQRIAQETLDIYAPLANRLGISWIKTELEDLSFKYLKPDEHRALSEQTEKGAAGRQKHIEEVIAILRKKLADASVEAQVTGRPKHLYSLWRKMKQQALEFEQVHDIVAFRIITKAMPACYEALGLVHSMWKPVPGRFKDYIAIPKPNGYQSLHTTVIGPHGERVEIQIRTEEMHQIAEEGIAAHWMYKEGKKTGRFDKNDQSFAWLRQLLDFQQDIKDPKEFLETVKVDLFSDEVFVFTPRGDVKSLPRGATPVDFAFAIHSEVGAHCVGAKVSGKIVPLRYRLKNGDTVEILTSPNAHPSKDWLTFVKTSRAQTRIRTWIRQQQRERSLSIGKELAERELKRYGLNFLKLYKAEDDKLFKAAQELGYRTLDDMVSALGYGKITPSQIVVKLVPPEELKKAEAPAQEEPPAAGGVVAELFKKVAGRSKTGVRISGLDDILVRFGRCCNPVPGDEIVGFITRGRGVTVHTRGCGRALESDPERRVDVSWDVKGEVKRPVTVRVISTDRPGLLAQMSETFTKAGINISQVNARATGDERAVSTFEVGVSDLSQLKQVIRAIEKLQGVHSVERM